LVVARGREVHHFYGAAGETKGHGPERALTCPVGDLVQCGAEGLLAGLILYPVFGAGFPGIPIATSFLADCRW
jgi:hypothetical protein